MKKVISIMLLVIMVLSLVACGKTGVVESGEGIKEESGAGSESGEGIKEESGAGSEKATDSTEIVDLKMVLVGDTPTRYEEIYGEINKMLENDVGARLSVEYLPWSGLADKYQLLFSTSDAVDLVFAANWLKYSPLAGKNAFYELTEEFLKENAPKTFETMPKSAWEQTKIGGKVYMVPYTGVEFETRVFMIRGDLREKLGMKEIKTFDDFEQYVTGVAEKIEGVTAIADIAIVSSAWGAFKNQVARAAVGGLRNGIVFAYDDKNGTALYGSMTDEKKEYWYDVRTLVEKGIVPEDLVANKSAGNMFENGSAATYTNNLETIVGKYEKWNSEHPEWKLELVDISGDMPQRINSYANNGMAISRKSKYPGKAMKVIELLRNDPRYFNLTFYGIENQDWEDLGNGVYKPIPDAEGKYFDLGCVWGWKNNDMLKQSQNELEFYTITQNKWVANACENPALDFIVDTSSFNTQLSALDAVSSEYADALSYGMIPKDQMESVINEYYEKVKSTGIDMILQECNRQMTEYLKTR